jgi:thioesterase domain-containing protein
MAMGSIPSSTRNPNKIQATPRARQLPLTPHEKFIVPVRHGTARPLFLVHSVAGELTWMPRLAQGLPADQPLFGFAAPGLNSQAPFFPNLEEMAAAYLSDIRAQQPHGPYLIGGYSMGGVVAFEMACQLEAAGQDIGLLVLIDSFAPHPHRGSSIAAWSRNGLLMQVVANQLARQWGADELLQAEALPSVSYSEHSVLAARHLLAHCRTPHTYDTLQPYLRRCQTVMRAHAELLAGYRPRALGTPCAAVLFRSALGLIGQDNALRLPVLPQAQRAPPHRWESLLARHDTVDIAQEHFLMGGEAPMAHIAATLISYLAAVDPQRQAVASSTPVPKSPWS